MSALGWFMFVVALPYSHRLGGFYIYNMNYRNLKQEYSAMRESMAFFYGIKQRNLFKIK